MIEENVIETKEKNEDVKEERPEPPKDENGNPIMPPHGHRSDGKDGERPEPPKDENGNPIAPPHHGKKPGECKTEEEAAEKPAEAETAEV